jgi:DNA-binding transcriptional LysR family regulator
VPFCAQFKEQHPNVHIEIRSQVEFLDLRRGQADLALRSRPPTEPGLVELHRLPVEMGIFASRTYRDSLAQGVTLEQLQWICWAEPYAHLPPGPQLEALQPGFRPAFASDSYLVQHRACQLGLGAMLLPRTAHPLMEDQGLVELPLVFPEPLCGALYLICPASMEYVPRVRTVAQALRQQMEQVVNPPPVSG